MPWIVAIAVQFLATVRSTEGWTVGNVFGALGLLALVVLVSYAVIRVRARR